MRCLYLLSATLFAHVALAAKQLPSVLMRCKENDISSMDCLKEATQKAIPDLVKGIQSLGVLSIDPLFVTEMVLDQGSDSPVAVKLRFMNESITGFGDMTIMNVEGSSKLEDFHLHFVVKIPNFQLIGQYVADGKILVLPITGKGHSNLTLTNMDVTADIEGKPFEKKGEKYLQITGFKLNIEPERLYMQFENLFGGDAGLGTHMNTFINDNWSLIYKELKPSIEDTFEAIFTEISNRIYSRIPYKNIVL